MKFTSPSILLFALYFVNGASVTAFPVGTEEQSLVQRQNVGSTITIDRRSYRLDREISGASGAITFEARQTTPPGGIFFAKRPTRNPPPADFTAEITNTRSASTVLGTNIFVSSGADLGFTWMITAPAPGVEIWLRWRDNKAAFATRAACDADMATARTVIVSQNQRLADDPRTRFVHGDNHPGNWFVPATGTIQTAVPIDFGIVRPPPPATNIANLVRDQYVYDATMWEFFSQNQFCR